MSRGADDGGRARAEGAERLYGLNPVREALRARRRELHWLRVRRGAPRRELREVLEAARASGVPVREVEPGVLLQGLPPGVNAQGVVLGAGALPETPLPDLVSRAGDRCTLVALDGVEDPQNVGAIARVAEGLGAIGLLMTRRRSPPLGPAVARASAGAIEWLPVSRVPNLARALRGLKESGFWVFGADAAGPLDLYAVPDRLLEGRRVVVLGAEGRGLRPGVARMVDHLIRIPLYGRLTSLNVSAAAAAVLCEIRRREQLAASPSFPYI